MAANYGPSSVCCVHVKMLQLLGNFVTQTLTEALHLDLTGGDFHPHAPYL